MSFGDIDLSFLRYESLQESYAIELSNGRVYTAKRADAAQIAPQFQIVLPSGAIYSKHTLPAGIEDVETYFLGYFTWLDAKTFQAPAREANEAGAEPIFQLPAAVQGSSALEGNLQGYAFPEGLQALAYEGQALQDTYEIDLGERGIYRAVRKGNGNIAPQFELFLPSGARYSLHTLPSGLDDVEIYFLGLFTWLDERTQTRA
jgi:hypothetical protein